MAILVLADKDIEDHASEVARLTEQLMIVQTEKQRLEAQRTKLRSLLSPMWKLPSEILLHIFQYICEENLFQNYPWLSDQDPPTKLISPAITYLPATAVSSVCSRWRELALSSPSLWANMTVETYGGTLEDPAFLDRIPQYLEQSCVRSTSELTEALHRCPSVKSIEIEVMDPRHNSPKDTLDSKMVFSSLSFPSLKELVVESAGIDRTPWPGKALISFLSTSSCIVTTFTLRDMSLSDLDISAVLRLMPSLLHLEIDDVEWDIYYLRRSPITSHLISELAQPQFLPKLYSLRLISHNEGPFNDRDFVSMVESRWFRPGSDLCMAMLTPGRGCIWFVVLKFGLREIDAEVYKLLRNLDEEGLRVVVAGTNGVQV
ncbi:hypothetical protein BDP27DRAFT_1424555 [Rhodocollybia butyracea]|uniref:F-box domain-containing protein n=1 Tax=Rhodocollybia butyracea TaxID=206335 RepID=A0A9P5PHB2_9AGAR|nr:hypothetical protein BDP27DRAFT_1424555 [Rhodocollybia butyracea]